MASLVDTGVTAFDEPGGGVPVDGELQPASAITITRKGRLTCHALTLTSVAPERIT
jgi:hypothetical protein